MTHIEIWLRLAQVNELYGDEMVRTARWLIAQPSINNTVLRHAGFTPRQVERFLAFSEQSLEKTLRWLELPHHHLVFADSKYFPPQLRAIEDYPGVL